MNDFVQLHSGMNIRTALQMSLCGLLIGVGVVTWIFLPDSLSAWKPVGIVISVAAAVGEFIILMRSSKHESNNDIVQHAYGFDPLDGEFYKRNQAFVDQALKFAQPGEYQLSLVDAESGENRQFVAVVDPTQTMRLYEGDTPSDINIVEPQPREQ
ncbi:hypothetical protein KIM372_14990 [Bombiscardovia nodaiensis]|uniref:Uncharacterized protein n=1 Tax=Bombiscardovia nodaiensis TaxID=2932181 RepID=A0ABN6SBT9_9BIFI|nr:hypothetical protein KIM372_14990 [Bombiscardovia nodaiensis]